MLSRRLFLSAGAATLALLPPGGPFGRALLARPMSSSAFDELGFDRMGALVAHAPELTRGRTAGAACPGRDPADYLRAEGLVSLPVMAAPGSAACDRRIAAVRTRLGGRRLGLVWWGSGAAADMATLSEAADALVLVDPIGAAEAGRVVSDRPVQCHFAARRRGEDRRVIERALSAVARAGSPLSCHWYDAEPGFAARPRPDDAADLAWRRTASFLRRTLAQSAPAGLPSGA